MEKREEALETVAASADCIETRKQKLIAGAKKFIYFLEWGRLGEARQEIASLHDGMQILFLENLCRAVKKLNQLYPE